MKGGLPRGPVEELALQNLRAALRVDLQSEIKLVSWSVGQLVLIGQTSMTVTA